jgi:ABC-type Mn2+/Zn2+ transport system permease subunit
MAGTERSPIWFAVVGGAVGLAVGILVSVTTDVPLAPEAGLLLGALLGWVAYRTRRR